MFLKYQVTQEDIDRGRAKPGTDNTAGITTTTATTSINGASTTFSYLENSNFLQVPPSVIGVTKIFILMVLTQSQTTCLVLSIKCFLMMFIIGDLQKFLLMRW